MLDAKPFLAIRSHIVLRAADKQRPIRFHLSTDKVVRYQTGAKSNLADVPISTRRKTGFGR